jgi:hypothetical protein
MEQESEYGNESGLYHQEFVDEKNTGRVHTTLVPHPDGEGADIEDRSELLNPLPGKELMEEEEKDRK